MRPEGAIETLEEATWLLRRAPAGAIAVYLAGSVPFLLGFLIFWADMSTSRSAEAACLAESLGVAALFLWLGCWKAVFAGALRRELEGVAAPPWTWRRAVRLFVIQAGAQPLKLVLLPASLLALLPFAFTSAFFRGVTGFADSDCEGPGEVFRRAKRCAAYAPRRNWIGLAILYLFSAVVFLNVAIALAALPTLVRILTGYETEFSRSGVHFVLNSTFLAAAAGITWLCVEPLFQAFSAVRCFAARASKTGEDLKAELRALAASAVLVLVGVLVCGAGSRACAAEAAPRAESVSAQALDRSIAEVLSGREYQWRLPRPASQPAPFARAILSFSERLLEQLRRAQEWVGDVVSRFREWMRNRFRLSGSRDAKDSGPPSALAAGLWILAGLAAAGSLLALRFRRRRARPIAAASAGALLDLTDESLLPTQLPEETWLEMAEQWLARRELRLALRAFYLGMLSCLGARELLSIHACKSNREYEAELRRKGRATPEVPLLFTENLRDYERSWYGRHEVDDALIARCRGNLDRLRAAAAGGGPA